MLHQIAVLSIEHTRKHEMLEDTVLLASFIDRSIDHIEAHFLFPGVEGRTDVVDGSDACEESLTGFEGDEICNYDVGIWIFGLETVCRRLSVCCQA